jgi:hypothetical protein
MPEWLKRKLREGGADNPYAVMNAAGVGEGDTKKTVKRKMSRFGKRVHRRKRRGATAGQGAAALASCLLLLLLAGPSWAQSGGKGTADLVVGYDVASTTLTYAAHVGARGDPWADPFRVNIPIETSGASTSVTAVTATTLPFADLAVGDLLLVRRDNSVTDRVWITVKTDGDNVTVSSSVDWSAGYTFEWMDLTTGTGATDGWISVSGYKSVQMTVQYEAGDLAGLDVVWECKEASTFSGAVQVYPGPSDDCGYGTLNTNVCTYATLGDRQTVEITHNVYSYCRVGLAYRTSDGGTREDVRVIVTAE